MSFQVFHDAEQPGYFRFVENWSKDKDWLIKVGRSFLSTFQAAWSEDIRLALAKEPMVLMWSRRTN